MPSEPQWLKTARAEGRVLSERTVAPTLPGAEAAEPGQTFEMLLPWPPTTNHYWAHFLINGKPRIGLSSKGSAYRKATVAAVGTVGRMTGPLSISIVLRPPTLTTLDLDNRIKPLLDAITTAEVWADDSQVRELHARFGPVDRNGGSAAVKIEPLADATDWGRIRIERDKLRKLALALLNRCGQQCDILTALAERQGERKRP